MPKGTGYGVAELSCMGKMRFRLSKRDNSPLALDKHYLIGKWIQYSGVPNFFQDQLEIKILIYNLMIFNYSPILLNIFIRHQFLPGGYQFANFW